MNETEFKRKIKESFLCEAEEILDEIESVFLDFEKNPEDMSILDSICRLAHSFKGAGMAVGFYSLSEFSHEMENLLVKIRKNEIKVTLNVLDVLFLCLDTLKNNIEILSSDFDADVDNCETILEIRRLFQNSSEVGNDLLFLDKYRNIDKKQTIEKKKLRVLKPDEYIRISIRKVDDFLKYLDKQSILHSNLKDLIKNLVENRDNITEIVSRLNEVDDDIRDKIMAFKKVSLKSFFSKMERVFRESSRALKKDVEFITFGENNELDRIMIESLVDPIMHMIRNAIDHGIEVPEKRIKMGKSPRGKIFLSAYKKGDYFYFEIKDDGKGIDKNKVLDKAIRLKMVKNRDKISENEIYNLICQCGFSTKEKLTNYSGRGFGMDVVRTSIEKMNGTCELKFEENRGTSFIIKLPNTGISR